MTASICVAYLAQKTFEICKSKTAPQEMIDKEDGGGCAGNYWQKDFNDFPSVAPQSWLQFESLDSLTLERALFYCFIILAGVFCS